MNRYVLIGPCSVGKTTIGKALARRLKVRFYDLDVIVDKKFKGLDKYIKKYGVNSYREEESIILSEFVTHLQRNFVLAVGGGTVASQFKDISKRNIKLLKTCGEIIYLCPSGSDTESIDLLFKNEIKRKGDKSLKDTEYLWMQRKDAYEKMFDKKILVMNKSLSKILKEIIL
jgi:shikimate kinase